MSDAGERAGHSAFTLESTLERTVEAWAYDYILSDRHEDKTRPAAPPALWAGRGEARDVRPRTRPVELRLTERAPRLPRPSSFHEPRARAKVLHTFWHHELQAAELMCWALLRFPEAEAGFRRGLVGVWRDEVRHMQMYAVEIERLGCRLGEFPVRDWFWERVPSCASPKSFVALMGMGFEAANMEHSGRFSEAFRAAGDHRAARVQERIGLEEVRHVRFATHWFEQWTGSVDFQAWALELPKPLTPLLMRGKRIDREQRRRAGMSDRFIDELEAYQPERFGRR
jgi:uncharacterized ferritin-like protein (DUF455 family)